MNTTVCNIDFCDQAPSSLSLDEQLSVAAALVLSLGFSGGLAWITVQALVLLQA